MRENLKNRSHIVRPVSGQQTAQVCRHKELLLVDIRNRRLWHLLHYDLHSTVYTRRSGCVFRTYGNPVLVLAPNLGRLRAPNVCTARTALITSPLPLRPPVSQLALPVAIQRQRPSCERTKGMSFFEFPLHLVSECFFTLRRQ